MCTPSNVWVSCFPCNFSNCAITLVHFLPAWQNVCNCAFGHLSRVWRSCTRACIHVLFTCPFVSFPHYSIEFLSLDRSPESLSRVQGLLSQLPVLAVPQPCSQPHLSSGLLKQPCLYSKSHKVFLTNSLSSSLQTSPHREPQISPRDLEERFHSALSSLLPTPPQPIKPTKCPHGFKTGTLTLRNGNKQPLAYKHMWGGEGGQCGWVGGKVLCRWGEGLWCVCMYRQYWYFSTEVDFSVLALNDQPVYRHLQMC